MKSLFASILLITIWLESYSQENKRGNIWVLGYVPAVTFDFNASMQVDTFANLGGTKVSSSIADTNGNLQFYSNGFGIVTSAGNLMENGSKVNCPFGQVLHDYYGGGSIFAQTSIILPRKGKTYYVFCTGMSDSVANNYLNHVYTEFDVLNYSVVDMDSNGGLGKVVQKNIVLADKQHYTNCAMQAVKHANGKDWWLVKADCRNNRYQEFLVTADTILGPFYQNCTVVGDICDYWGSQVIFDSAGATMACSMYGSIYGSAPNLFSYWNRTEIYDFDRCDGSIFHRKTYYAPYDTTSYPDYDFKVGICFSPNGKLLYMSTKYSIFQIDVEDTSQNNAILINGPDTTLANFPYYSLMGSAPDGKLYIGNWNALRKYMSFIDSPNVRGLGCAFRAQGLWQH